MNKITINGVEIPLEKVCVFCNGELECQEAGEPPELCGKCKNGKQPIYYTPQQIEGLTGEKLPGDTAVWVLFMQKDYHIRQYQYLTRKTHTLFIAFPYQPAPPADYRVEE